MATTKDIKNLIINKVENQEVFDYMKENELVSEDELYLVQGEDVQPDWGENDPEAAGYIKNRTHWVEYHSELRDVISATSTRNADTGAWSTVPGFYGYDGATGTWQYLINNGDVCTVLINGVAYECTCFSQTLSSDNATANEDTDWYYQSIGSAATFYMKDVNVSSAEIVIQKNVQIPTYHKIPDEYVNLPEVSYKVLPDRPFYEDIIDLVTDYAFSGSSLSGTALINGYYSLHEGMKHRVVLDGMTYVFEYTSSGWVCEDAMFSYVVYSSIMTTWAISGLSDEDHTISISEIQLKQLDEKFIPDSIKKAPAKNWNQNDSEAEDYIKGRTHYFDYEAGEEIKRFEYTGGTTAVTWSYVVTIGGNTSDQPTSPMVASVNGGTPVLVAQENSEEAEVAGVLYKFTYFQNSTNSWTFIHTYYLKDNGLINSIVFYEATKVYHPLDEQFIPDTVARTNNVSVEIQNAVSEHDQSESAHSDIRTLANNAQSAAGNATSTANEAKNAVESLIKLPTVTSDNNGQFLRVVNGVWAAATIENAEEVSF